MRPLRSLLVPPALALALFGRATPCRAQDYSGTWRITRDDVAVTIGDWGAPCGPRPASRQGATGHEVTVRAEGNNLVLAGGRSNRTDRCWSDNRDVTLRSATHPAPDRWVVTCATPDGFALGERGQYTLAARDASHLEFRDETTYAWTIQGTSCRASSVLTREYQRVGAAPVQQATEPTRPAPPAPAPRPPARCATPGPAATLVVSPSRRSTTAGVRTCFHARVLDANHCEVPTTGLIWAAHRTAGTAEGSMERGCFVPTATSSEGEFEVSASAGALNARATAAVVTVDRYRALIAAHLEDPDAGVEPAAPASGVQIGGVPVESHPEAGPHRPLVPLMLLGLAVLLALGGIALLLTRRRPAAHLDPTSAPGAPGASGTADAPPMQSVFPSRARRDAVSLSAHDMPVSERPPIATADLGRTIPDAAPPSPPEPLVPAAPSVAAEPARRCPACGAHFGGELAFCPQDGAALLPLSPGAAPAPGGAAPVMVCPRCGARVIDGSRFCSDDGTALVPSMLAPASSAPLPASSEGTCPVCKRRYPGPIVFCGEDGARLVRA